MVGMKTTYKLKGEGVLKEFKTLAGQFYDSDLVESSYQVGTTDDDGITEAELTYKVLKEHSNDDGEIKPLLLITLFQHKFSRFEVKHESIQG